MKIISTIFMLLILYGLYVQYQENQEDGYSIVPVIVGLFCSFIVLVEVWT